jgi:hypothetical protein
MNVLLVNPQPTLFLKSATCPLGILSIATYMKDQNHTVKIIDRDAKKYYKKNRRILRLLLPLELGFFWVLFQPAVSSENTGKKYGLYKAK